MEDFVINETHCFKGENYSISTVQEALQAHRSKSKNVADWLHRDSTPIFLDANVLLNIYMLAMPNRDNLLRFLTENRERIYITDRVQIEYLRHRLEFIDKYRQKLTVCASQVRKSLEAFDFKAIDRINDILTSIVKEELVDSLPESQKLVEEAKAKIEQTDVVNETYNEIKQSLSNVKGCFEKEYNNLYSKASIEYNDCILEKISQLNILDPLTKAEVEFTIKHYEELMIRFEANKSESAAYFRFPGSGERQNSEKKVEPWGDLLIYHEILSFMAKHHSDAIFLTFDKSKNDWMKKGGEEYSYYTIDSFQNTRQTLFIFRADDFLTGGYKSTPKDNIDEDSVGVTLTSPLSNSTSASTIQTKNLLKISKEEFLRQLKSLKIKNGDSENAYISKSFFIYVYLGKQGYRYSSSFQILDQLRDKKVEEYDYNNGTYTFKCLRLIEGSFSDKKNELAAISVDELKKVYGDKDMETDQCSNKQ